MQRYMGKRKSDQHRLDNIITKVIKIQLVKTLLFLTFLHGAVIGSLRKADRKQIDALEMCQIGEEKRHLSIMMYSTTL